MFEWLRDNRNLFEKQYKRTVGSELEKGVRAGDFLTDRSVHADHSVYFV